MSSLTIDQQIERVEKRIEAMEAVLDNKATKDQSSVAYNGRSISRLSWEELQNAIDRETRKLRRLEDKRDGAAKIKSVGMRFIDA